ncbi:MAG: TrmH family RNA methyltransferase [Myxococcota bacterium]
MAGRRTEMKRFMRAQPKPERAIAFLLANVEDPVNVGSAFRVADACKAEIVLAGITARPPHKLISKVGRGKENRVPWRAYDNVVQAIEAVQKDGWPVWAVEITDDAQPYHRAHYPSRVCLMVGHEDHGVPKKALQAADGAIFIPMYGKGASLNVHVALSVAAFQALHAESPSGDALESAPTLR